MKYQIIKNNTDVVAEVDTMAEALRVKQGHDITASLGYRQGNRDTYTVKEVEDE